MNELVFKGLGNAKQVITCNQSRLPFVAKNKRKKRDISYFDTQASK
jgi:hypothetical protein